MSPEDYHKCKSSFEPAPAKEDVPLAVQLANKTKERGTVMGRIEHYRNVCRDLETKLMKQSELLEEAVERKATLQNEINELEVRIAEESRVPPVPPPGPPPAVPVVFLPHPADENEEDEENGKRSSCFWGWCWRLRFAFQEEGESSLRFGNEPLSD